MRLTYLVPVIIFGLLMAGCGKPASGGPSNPDKSGTSPTSTSMSTASGMVRGQVLRPPGPDPRSGKVGTTVPVSGDPVRAKDSRGQVVATAVTTQDGHFELTLPPGTYQISEDTCGISQQIEIRSGATAWVNLSITNAC